MQSDTSHQKYLFICLTLSSTPCHRIRLCELLQEPSQLVSVKQVCEAETKEQGMTKVSLDAMVHTA